MFYRHLDRFSCSFRLPSFIHLLTVYNSILNQRHYQTKKRKCKKRILSYIYNGFWEEKCTWKVNVSFLSKTPSNYIKPNSCPCHAMQLSRTNPLSQNISLPTFNNFMKQKVVSQPQFSITSQISLLLLAFTCENSQNLRARIPQGSNVQTFLRIIVHIFHFVAAEYIHCNFCWFLTSQDVLYVQPAGFFSHAL